MPLEEDVSFWGKIIGFIIGGATLIGTLLSVGKEWNSLKWRVRNLEVSMEGMEASMLRMQEKSEENTRAAMEATQKVAIHAERFEGNVKLMVDAVDAIKDKVDRLEQHQ